jgi:hypothetical protein
VLSSSQQGLVLSLPMDCVPLHKLGTSQCQFSATLASPALSALRRLRLLHCRGGFSHRLLHQRAGRCQVFDQPGLNAC